MFAERAAFFERAKKLADSLSPDPNDLHALLHANERLIRAEHALLDTNKRLIRAEHALIAAHDGGPHAAPKAPVRSTTTMGLHDARSMHRGSTTHDARSTGDAKSMHHGPTTHDARSPRDGTSTGELRSSGETPTTTRSEPVAQQSSGPPDKILLAGDDNLLRDAARRAQPLAGYIDVIVHADADRFWVVRDWEDIPLDHRALATYVRKHGLENQKIRLIACEAGMWPHAVAQHLANKLRVDVLAPNRTAWIDGKGNVGVGSRNEHQGKWEPFHSRPSSADGAKAHLLIPEEPYVPLDPSAPEETPPLQVRFDHRERYHVSRHDELQAVLGKPLHVNPNMVDGVRMTVSREHSVFGTQYHVRGIAIGAQTRTADIWAHAELVRLVERYNGLVGAVRKLWERLRGNAAPRYPHGSRGWVLAQEIEKVRKHIEATKIMENTGLLDAERAAAEIAHLEGAEAYFRDELRDLEVYSPGRAQGHDALFDLSRPDVGQTTREAEAAGYKRPGHDGVAIDGVEVKPEWYYYRRSKADPGVFELARTPDAPAQAPQLKARVVGGRFIGFEKPAVEDALKLVHIPAGKELDTLYKPDGTMAPYAAMLERTGVATKNVIDGAALILRRQLAERPNATIDTWRHAVKDYFRQRVVDKLLDPRLDADASYQQMRQMLDGLGNADRGNLVETWYLARNHPGAKRQVVYDVERTSGRNKGKTERRVADGLSDETIIEVKDGANPIDPEQFGAYVDWMKQFGGGDETGGTPIEKLTYVFTKPEGALANLEFMAKALKHSDLKKRLVIQVFDRVGKMHEVRTSSDALGLLQQLKADL